MKQFSSIHKLLIVLITFSSIGFESKAQTTYKDVAPIFIANCTACHHSGGIQFALTKYSEVQAMGAAIKSDIENNVMPPWPADPNYKHYVHERVVSAADKTTLINWIDAGMPAGDTTLAPAPPPYGNAQLYGTPDLILHTPNITSTATTNDMYYCVNVPTGLTQDRYIRAFEFIPGNPAIIHHAVITIDTLGTAVNDMSGGCYNFQGQVNIGDYAPGMGPTVLPGVVPTKFGFRLKAGSKMSFQIHVPEGTAGMQDSSELRIYFYPLGEPNIRPMFFETVLQNWSFFVPANDSITATAKYPTGAAGVPIDISLYGTFPHSHKTCTGILNFGYKGTDTIPLIRIPHWDFHWQGQYTFNNLVKLPATYHLWSAHKFDNTTNNPETPDHNVPVSPGYFTNDEMLFDSYLYTYYLNGDDTVDIAAILANDPLFYPTSTNDIATALSDVLVYPNPFTNHTSIEYHLLTSQFVQISLYNSIGQKVNTIASSVESSGKHSHSWNGTDMNGQLLPTGMYTFTIQAGQQTKSGKILLQQTK